MLIDISQEVFSCVVYPGDPSPQRNVARSIAEGDMYNLSELSMCVHNGTHIDSPFHFLRDGRTVEQIPLESFVGPCYVCRRTGDLTGADAEDIVSEARKLSAGDRILIAGGAVVTAGAARVFAGSGVLLLGIDSQSFGPEGAPMEVHVILLSKDIVLLEGLCLDGVSEGRYFLSAAPLNLAGCDGAPCRAFLMTED